MAPVFPLDRSGLGLPLDRSGSGLVSSAPLFGRDDALDAIRARLAAPGIAAVTGPAGIGKSRLLAAAAGAWDGEVTPVELRGAATRADVVLRLAIGLGAAGAGERASEPEVARVGTAVARRRGGLLVLDGADAAVDALDAVLAEVRARAPELRCLVGTRVRLPRADATFALGPLDPASARALYLARAGALVPEDALDPAEVDALVVALDGVPLAIELAAARVRVYPPGALRTRLSAALGPLFSALDASVGLLSPDERGALAAASVFRGSFDGEAFEEVTGRPSEALEALLDGSLVDMVGPGRLRMLDPVRTYAVERLEEPERTEVLARHAAWVGTRAEALAASARRTGDLRPLEALRADLGAAADRGHVRAALHLAELGYVRGPVVDPGPWPVPAALRVRWGCLRARILGRQSRHAAALAVLAPIRADEVDNVDLAVELATARLTALGHLARFDEADAELAALRDVVADPALDPRLAIEAHLAAAVVADRRGDGAGAIRTLEQARALVVGHGNVELEARVLGHLGVVLRQTAPAAASAHLRRAAERYHELGDDGWEGVVLGWLGVNALEAGDLALADEALARSSELCARAGDATAAAKSDLWRISAWIERRRFTEAAALGDAIRATIHSPWMLAMLRAREGQAALLGGDLPGAVRALDEAIGAVRALGPSRIPAVYLPFLAVALASDDPERSAAVFRDAEDEARRLGGDYPALVALARAVAAGAPLDGSERAERGTPAGHAERLMLGLGVPTARVAADGSWFDVGEGRVELTGRPVLRRLLATLAERPGRAVGRAVLVDTTWPGERMRADSAAARLHAAVRTLRKLGLGEHLVTTDAEGDLAYALDARVRPADGPVARDEDGDRAGE